MYEGEAELEASDFATVLRPTPGIAGTSTLLGVVSKGTKADFASARAIV